jgi:polar amino acid transport system permease protein
MGKSKAIMQGVIWFLRGSPLMIQLFIVMYVPGLLFNIPIKSRFTVAVIAFSINYAAYFCEIFRGGIESIPKGQWEAGQVLGLSKWAIERKIVFPQVVKKIIPPFGNELLTLIKDTTLARVIAVPEMLMASTEFTTKGLIWPLFYTTVFFLIATAFMTFFLKWLEGRFAYYEG